MKVLMFNGSPHKNGCTYTALHEMEKILNESGIETEIMHIGDKAIQSCICCRQCRKAPFLCAFDDIVNEAVIKSADADAYVVGSPVHYGAASGALTAFLDRFFFVNYDAKIHSFKLGCAVVSCRRAGSTAALEQLNKYFLSNNMPIVPSQYWNIVHGSTPDEVRQDLEGMQTMRTLARNMVWMLRSFECARNSGIMPPKHETRIATNFIR